MGTEGLRNALRHAAAVALLLTLPVAGCGGKDPAPGRGKSTRASGATAPAKGGPSEKLLPERPEEVGANPGPRLDERLARADALIGANRFDEAVAALDQFLAASPADAGRLQAEQLRAKIEDRRRVLAELRELLPKLASQDRREAIAAQNRFFERADVSVAVLGDAVRQGEAPVARAAIETLARLKRPQETSPLLVEVLGRPEQKALWPDAVRAMETAGGEGVGGPLLDLALSTQDPEQRAAALGALARASDPPLRAAAALLPWISRDGPELPAALAAFARIVAVHRLHDLATRRGWDVELSPEAQKQLDALPGRLAQLLAGGSGEAAAAARRVAILTRQIPADPLPGVRVLAFSAELQDGPAGAVLDGQWNTTDGAKMWRHPAAKPGSLVLDLGQTRTVCGVRIWNLNEAGAPQRGWKEVAVYVGDSPVDLTVPASAGQLPPSPGAADAPDFSATIPVDFRQGRYVRLRAVGLLSQDQRSGLAEVQVLGY